MQHLRLGEPRDDGTVGHRVLGRHLVEERVGSPRARRAEVDGEQRVPGRGVAAGHVVEDEARGGEVSPVGVGGEEGGPGDDVAAGHLVEQELGVAEAAAAAVRREQRVEVRPVGARGGGGSLRCREPVGTPAASAAVVGALGSRSAAMVSTAGLLGSQACRVYPPYPPFIFIRRLAINIFEV